MVRANAFNQPFAKENRAQPEGGSFIHPRRAGTAETDVVDSYAGSIPCTISDSSGATVDGTIEVESGSIREDKGKEASASTGSGTSGSLSAASQRRSERAKRLGRPRQVTIGYSTVSVVGSEATDVEPCPERTPNTDSKPSREQWKKHDFASMPVERKEEEAIVKFLLKSFKGLLQNGECTTLADLRGMAQDIASIATTKQTGKKGLSIATTKDTVKQPATETAVRKALDIAEKKLPYDDDDASVLVSLREAEEQDT